MNIALVCCPQWSFEHPPYNISLLSAILKENGYNSRCFDFNIEAYHYLKNESENYWNGQNFFYWTGKKFHEHLLTIMEDFIELKVKELLQFNPTIIGFTVYDVNLEFTRIIVEKIKEKKPFIKIIAGGAQCIRNHGTIPDGVDVIVKGEGELDILDAIKNAITYGDKFIKTNRYVDINKLPFPDYSDYDLSKYASKLTFSIEFSRGCTNKCTFCVETNFWKYRTKKAERFIEEIEYYIGNYNTKYLKFSDSLMNGNIKEFRRFVDLLIEKDIKIKWGGYARIDKRMNKEFLRRIKKSGNYYMSYGIESGSQNVLNDMKKNIKIEDIEQNLSDGYDLKVYNNCNWIIGYPSETHFDFLKSLLFLSNNKKNINSISPGVTCGVGYNSELYRERDKHNISANNDYWNEFATKDFRNTAIHRFLRLKFTHIWLNLVGIRNGQGHKKLIDHYNITFHDKVFNNVDYHDCIDFDYIYDETFQSSLYIEYITFFHAIFKVFGAFDMDIRFNSKMDIDEFGDKAKEYNSIVQIKSKTNGDWLLNLNHKSFKKIHFNESIAIKNNEVIK